MLSALKLSLMSYDKMMDLSKATMMYSQVKLTSMLSSKARLAQMICYLCSRLMAHNSSKAKNLIAGFTFGLFSTFRQTAATRKALFYQAQSFLAQKSQNLSNPFSIQGSTISRLCNAAVQWEGLQVWDAAQDCTFVLRLFFFLGCADRPGLITLSNLVGHQGKCGCHMLCPLTGRCKPGGSQYYPVLLKPDNYDVPGCNHGDVNAFDIRSGSSAEYVQHLCYILESRTMDQFQSRHLETGIIGPSILLGLEPTLILGIPECFSSEIMHLIGANMASLWLDLFRGTIECAHTDDRSTWFWAMLKNNTEWEAHG